MILATVGSQVYNSWCNSRRNEELQQKREEYERAARERNTEQMWRLLREGQKLTMQLEAEKHQQRLAEMKDELDNLLHKLTYETAISNWPLKILPIVMKNQAFGNLLANQEESVAMHIFFTRSNYEKFNRLVFPVVEKELEEFCNKYWSTVSDHPVLFYSGAWKTPNNPTSIQIDALRSELTNLPTLLIMPFFRPSDGKLVFHVHIWGVGALSSNQFEIPEIEPICDDFHFKYTYTNQQDYEKESEVLESIVKELVPYLQCLIGFMVDTYFWASSGLAPHLPLLVTNGTINTDGMNYLLYDSCVYYIQLLDTSIENTKANPFAHNNLLNLYEGSAELWDDNIKKKAIGNVYISYCTSHSNRNFLSMEDCVSVELFTKEDLPFIKKFRATYKYSSHQKELENIQKVLESLDFEYSIMSSTDVPYLNELAKDGNGAAMFRLGEIFEYSIKVERYDTIKSTKYYNDSLNKGFILADFYAVIHDASKDSIRRFTLEELYVLNTLHNMGIIIASIFLSQYYYYGPEKNNNKVIKYLEDAPDTEHPYLYFWAAKVLMDLHGKKEERSIEYNLEKSANYGYIEAQTLLMNWYQKKGNKEKVFKYAKLAAKQGSLKGISTLGYCLLTGLGTYKDKARGVEMLKFAAQKGDQNALEILKKIVSNEK